MKQETHHHLVFLFTNTCFLKRQFIEKNSRSAEGMIAYPLKNGRWINTILEILPDLPAQDPTGELSSAWEIVTTAKFIQIKTGSATQANRERST